MIIRTRNKVGGFLYRNAVKPIAFYFDPEAVHNFFIKIGRQIGKSRLSKTITRDMFYYGNRKLRQKMLGIQFDNPVGLSAGFDKNAQLAGIMGDVGFGFAEVGSVTAKACLGNPGKRLARIPEKESLWINLGLNNRGADKVYENLSKSKYDIPIGVSVAKTNCRETAKWEIGLQDYIYTVKKFAKIADYITLNISCPNAYGGQDFAKPQLYERLLKEVKKLKLSKPIFVKLSPDLTKKNIDAILRISSEYKVGGFICSNLTKKHYLGNGGMSGKFMSKKAEYLLSYLYKKTHGQYILVGAGGIFSAEDAYRKIKLGANLVQMITGMIYRGPTVISEINHGLVELLEKDGYNNIAEAVGASHKR